MSAVDALKTLGADPAVIAFAVLLTALVAFSKKVAEIRGPLGALARWFYSRAERRVQREEDLERARSRRESAAYRTLEARMHSIEGQMTAMEQRHDRETEEAAEELARKNAFIVALLRWVHDALATAAQHGVTLPNPPKESDYT